MEKKTRDHQEILDVIRQLAMELHPDFSAATVDLDSSLDRDFGLDSLARMELLTRFENRFGIRMPEQVLATAETPRDLLRHLEKGEPATPERFPQEAAPSVQALGDEGLPERASTLVEALLLHAASHPDRVHILLDGYRDDPVQVSYDELLRGARKIGAGLQEAGLEPGNTVALILPTGTDYFFSFFGVLLAGGIPVPLYPPVRPTQIEEHLRRHRGILQNAGVKILLTVPEVKPVARLLKLQVATLETIVAVAEISRPENLFVPVPVQPADIAFLQYTSGSTGDPKGVVLTHANLLANIRAMGRVTKVSSKDVFVSWLPLYHDMGLIGAWLGSLYFGCRLVIMPPLSFLARPERWLWAIHKHRGTMSASPNFGYELCYRRIRDKDIEGVDLRSWRLAFNGAEPVTPEAINNFSQRFESYGFRPEAMAPVYGLAESSVGLAFPPPGRKPIVDRIDRDIFVQSGRAEPLSKGERAALEFVACGQPLPGHQIRVVDRGGRELPDRQEGILEFKGPSATSGYYRSPDKTRVLFHDDWLDSGDLGYMAEGDLYVTSRIKDIIIKGGRNVYPHELEEAVGNIQGVRKGSIAVFGSREAGSGTERLIVLAESRKRDPDSMEKLRREISNVSVDLLGMPPDDVVIAPPGTVLKTSSGKIRRAASRDLYEKQRIGKPGRAVWLQLVRLVFSGFLPQARRILRQGGDLLYAGYCWAVYGLLSVPVWLLAVILPGRKSSWLVTKYGARLLARLTGTRLLVQGLEHIPVDRPIVIVSNHMSYLDGYFLQAVLPVPCSFIAKAELGDRFLLRVPLLKLGAVLVERFDREGSAGNARYIAQLAAEGRVFLFFPEGTFQRMPGLLPFRMGAFLTSIEAGIPVVPVTIRGTRSKMRGNSWFPRRGPLSMTVSRPVQPEGDGWEAAIKLREKVRREILRHLGEPDLAGSFTPFAEVVKKDDGESG
ncbi:MAG TPA: acyl-phosphate glycerol 3-phosphate acyltransferase [Desulfobacteraceae bacterium]|nr:acyl-phosphate glycerol 3-phosphate acyltransferase [Desulfobacteraceae bacterium]